MKTQSILPNSAPHILNPVETPIGVMQVRWDEEGDTHRVWLGEEDVAGHHNGFSCYALITRIASEDRARALDQVGYIKQCGGYVHDSVINKIEGLSA